MKRIDMQNKIAAALGLIMTSPSMNVQDGASLILDVIEENGMLPPGLNLNGDGESLDYDWESDENN
jgi:hypothetical protein